jgi:hypothetical protein
MLPESFLSQETAAGTSVRGEGRGFCPMIQPVAAIEVTVGNLALVIPMKIYFKQSYWFSNSKQ